MNLPNFLTFSRFLLAGIFLYVVFLPGYWAKVFALVVFLLATLTDYLDGWAARKMNLKTAFGALMDPIADKFLTLSAFLAFVQMNIVPAWMVALILTRDILITIARFSIPPVSQGARKSGKQKTVLQFAAIVGVLGYLIVNEAGVLAIAANQRTLDIIYWMMFVIVVFTVWSGASYLYKNKEYLVNAGHR